MKVCALTHTYPRFPDDINAPFVEHLMERIASAGHDVSVLTAFDPAWNRTPGDHTVDLRTYRYIWPDSLHILGYSRTIEGNVRFRKRVLVLSPFLFAGAYRSFSALVRERRPDILHAHWILPNGFVAGEVSRRTGVPLIIQLHGSDVFVAEKNALYRSMARRAAAQASYILSPSPDLTRRIAALGVDPEKIGLVPNTVDENFASDVTDAQTAELQARLNISENAVVVLAMGRMVHVKGFTYLIDAFSRIAPEHPEAVLVLAGGGILYDDMRVRAGDLGVGDRVIMPGAVMRDEVPVYFSMADMFVIPSIRHESGAVDGLPVVVPEAMAAGLPVIGSDLSGIPVLVRDGYNGVLVPERDTDGLARALDDLIRHSEMRAVFGERSQRLIREHVNYGTVASHIAHVYEEIAFRGTSPGNIRRFDTGFPEEAEKSVNTL